MVTRTEHSEDGAVAVIVAICLLMLFGAGAIAIDLGSGWETKRGLVVDTDSAALAAGHHILGRPCASAIAGATDVAEDFVELNAANFDAATGPTTTVDCAEGTVRVDYGENAQTTLAPAIGVDEIPVAASTTVAFDFVGGGLRPFSVCMTDPDIADWALNGNGNVPGNPSQFDLAIDKSFDSHADSSCGGAPGNWGLVCFVEDFGGGNLCTNSGPGDGIPAMIRNGYEGDVDLGGSGPSDEDCDPLDESDEQDCDGRTGNLGNAVFKALDDLLCHEATAAEDCEYRFPILGISEYTAGPGNNATMNPTHFVGVVVRAPAPDPDYSPPNPDFVRFELTDLFDSGSVLDAGSLEKDLAVCKTDGTPDAIGC